MTFQPQNRHGQRFAPGVSGNPGGRPRSRALREVLLPHSKRTAVRLLKLSRSASSDATKLEAIRLILAYLHGKPSDTSYGDMSTEELIALLRQRSAELEAEESMKAAPGTPPPPVPLGPT